MKLSDIKVLVCDDSILVRKRLRELLATIGCTTVWEASNGEQAVSMYKEHLPDIVFMDIIMPGKTGLEALREIRAHNSEAKVVMASSVGTQTHLKEAVSVGVFDFLQKPIANEQVLKIIRNIQNG